MSRLTASPFHKPSPFEFPRAPLSPPETNSDRTGPSPLALTTVSVLGGMPADSHHLDSESAHRSQSPETAGARFRRVSTLAYHNSSLRESRERAAQRATKSFVVVIPPSAILREHGQLGHTLSLGPRHRLSQGMLMPLFPTMYSQLTAIAREYNFPSISGLCLYLHFTENGITATPRVSDDTWQLIWSNVFDAPAPLQRLPIAGKIEFDIDLRHARWYPSWLSSSQREQLDVPASVVPSTAPSVAHYRGDSRTTDLEINMNDEQIDSNSVSPQSAVPMTRHVPRKLSLVDRLDPSLRSASKPSSRPVSSPREHEQVHQTQVLSPIFQEDEPKTARLDTLETRVNTWRASASLTPTALAARGQTSLEPANLPNTMVLDDVATAADEDELNLEDFTWSVSSLGPNDWEEGTILSWDRLPSVHLANRMESSVCMTPSDCTSFGPSDYTLPSPLPSMDRVLTPDIAHRMYEDVPPTPSTATSWGPPSEYPTSLMSFDRASSVDIGERLVFSSPPTPMTATSWGPGSWPPTPATPHYVHTPDVGQRSFDLDDLEVQRASSWGHVWQYTSLTFSISGVPWSHVWPYTSCTVTSHIQDEGESSSVSVQLPCVYPSLNIYPAVYPYFDVYPAEPSTTWTEPVAYPNIELYPTVNTPTRRRSIVCLGNFSVEYPNFDLYPAVNPASLDVNHPRRPLVSRMIAAQNDTSRTYGYPDFDIYSSSQVRPNIDVIKVVSWSYPIFDLYPAVYPYVLPYPSEPRYDIQQTSTSSGYPNFELYPLKFPVLRDQQPKISFDRATWSYPIFDLYPAVYPHVAPYPTVPRIAPSVLPRSQSQNVNVSNAPAAERISQSQLYSVIPGIKRSTSCYPVFDLYPVAPPPVIQAAVRSYGYPTFDIYPSTGQSVTQVTSHFCGYPDFDIYPVGPSVISQVTLHASGYPDFNIYPCVGLSVTQANTQSCGYPDFDIYPSKDLSVAGTSHFYSYPDFNIYPCVGLSVTGATSHFYGYPDFDIYPAVKSSVAQADPGFDVCPSDFGNKASDIIVAKLVWSYPIFDLYPAVYPHVTPYPSVRVEALSKTVSVSGYPDLKLYPCRGYPDFDLYSSLVKEQPVMDIVEYVTKYPVIDLYPVVYPHTVLYPSMIAVTSTWSPEGRSTLPPVCTSGRKRLTHAELHAMVMLEKPWSKIPHKVRRSHRSLHDEVFANGATSTSSGILMETDSIVRVIPLRPVGRTRSGSIAGGLPPRPNNQTASVGSEASPTFHVQKRVVYTDSTTVGPTLQSSGLPASSRRLTRLTPESSAQVENAPSTTEPPAVGTPLRRAVSSGSRPQLAKRTVVSHLAPVDETGSSLSRSSSMTLPSRTNDPSPILSPPRRRESLVLQRAKVFENNDDAGRISMATLKEFPLPPRPPVPSLPSRHSFLERSKPL